ncbi:hypothetical protein [Variovorax sp. N23]|uniref:hypothetical protein n=1 Tax=Variovorax sp. N23 TaxID=2980555 RepID=UPI0021C85190|nr:hypothetical protein [Variovorax sp. N23]MCU4121197.1 hypothetical protein [Variovorax sp. N23]
MTKIARKPQQSRASATVEGIDLQKSVYRGKKRFAVRPLDVGNQFVLESPRHSRRLFGLSQAVTEMA